MAVVPGIYVAEYQECGEEGCGERQEQEAAAVAVVWDLWGGLWAENPVGELPERLYVVSRNCLYVFICENRSPMGW